MIEYEHSMASPGKIKHKHIIFQILRIALGLFFLTVAIAKLFKLDSFVEEIATFSLFPMEWEEWIAYLGLACEITVGLCLLFKRIYIPAVLLANAMTLTFVALFVQGWIRGLSLTCHCVGVERTVSNYPFEVGWRVLLFLATLTLLWDIYLTYNTLFASKKLKIPKHI